MDRKDVIAQFNPNDIGSTDNNIFGLPFSQENASLVIIPVPWEVTVSYNAGTAKGPEAIYEASYQVDLYDNHIEDAWKLGMAMLPISKKVKNNSHKLRKKAEKYISLFAQGQKPDTNSTMLKAQLEINAGCAELNKWVKKTALKHLENEKLVALLGGDHSTPLGLLEALAEKNANFGVLQIDAHADLRDAYEGFEFSHASIMYNAVKIPQISKLVQVGIRDYCEDEKFLIDNHSKVKTFFDSDLKEAAYLGETWDKTCSRIVKELPKKVYISFDIDGLDPKLCPNTGTPVPGGFEFEQVVYLFKKLVEAKKQIIGFDINEVAPGKGDWDANVGARLLYKLGNLCMHSNGIKPE